jgi:hypothetical protein
MAITHTPDPANAILTRTEYEAAGTHTGSNDHDHSGADQGGSTVVPVATHAGLTDPHTGYILKSLFDAKGDLILASADNTPIKLSGGSGNNDHVLTRDSSTASGWKVAAVPSIGAHSHDALVSANPGGMWPSAVSGSSEPARLVTGDATMYVIEYLPDVNSYAEGTIETPDDWTGDLSCEVHWWGSDAAAAVTVYAADTFTRTQSDNTWGNAETPSLGWTEAETGATSWSVSGGVGYAHHTAASQTKRNELRDAAINQRDVRLRGRVTIDKAPTGGNADHLVLFRSSATGDASGVTKYALLIRRPASGSLQTQFRRYTTSVATDVPSGGATLSGVVNTDSLEFMIEVEGINPTALRSKVWKTGDAEPGAWQVNVNDLAASDFETTGGYGIRTFVSATNVPILMGLDNFQVESLTAAASTAAKWELRVLGYADGEALTATWLTATTVTDTNATGVWLTTASMTQSHPTLAGKVLQFRLGRLGADAADNVPDSVFLRGLRIILDRTP